MDKQVALEICLYNCYGWTALPFLMIMLYILFPKIELYKIFNNIMWVIIVLSFPLSIIFFILYMNS